MIGISLATAYNRVLLLYVAPLRDTLHQPQAYWGGEAAVEGLV